jgi:hypothetical protein
MPFDPGIKLSWEGGELFGSMTFRFDSCHYEMTEGYGSRVRHHDDYCHTQNKGSTGLRPWSHI